MKRSSGILAHVSSLPGPYATGTMGKSAYAFIDYIRQLGFSHWQILPLNPPGKGDSPYTALCAFAGNPNFIDPELLAEDGLLTPAEAERAKCPEAKYACRYRSAEQTQMALLSTAFSRADETLYDKLALFERQNEYWLTDYALYMSLKHHFDQLPWWSYPDEGLRLHQESALSHWSKVLREEITFWKFVQYLFDKQWRQLKRYANERGVAIIGDMPFYVSMDSSDAWANHRLFELDARHLPKRVAGVPPDYFSPTGQLWGNPLYDWAAMKEEGYAWWIARVQKSLALYDQVRIDHFRALASYWAVDAKADTAMDGGWEQGPGMDFFNALHRACPRPAIIAEDLGLIGEDVVRLLDQVGYPGMRVMQFAFDPNGDSLHLPHHYPPNCIAYTGTHDNNTLLGWIWEATPPEREFAMKYCNFTAANWSEGGKQAPVCRAFMRTLWQSAADLVIVPIQDLLGFGSDTRINIPGVAEGNWRYRFTEENYQDIDGDFVRELNRIYRRWG